MIRRIPMPTRLLFSILLLCGPVLAPLQAADEPAEAELKVSGLGWWRNRELRVTLERLLGEDRGATLAGNEVEDAVFLLMSALEGEGYLRPIVEVVLTLPDGGMTRHLFDESLSTLLPRPLEVSVAEFQIREGVRYVFETVEVVGLDALPEQQAREMFRPADGLLPSRVERLYSPARLRRTLDALHHTLLQLGYAESIVEARDLQIDHRTGAVDLVVEVNQGARWQVESVQIQGGNAPGLEPVDLDRFTGRPWNTIWQQDVAAEIRQQHFRAGYPDVRVQLSHTLASPAGGERPVTVSVRTVPGPQVRIGTVEFSGHAHTRDTVLERRVRVESGDLLDPLELERTRYRLGQLGIFDSVDLRYEPSTGAVRNPVFVLDESGRWEASLLAGYGSYEQFRAGLELRQTNLFGRAHSSRLQLVQSVKSSRGDYTYSVPELFGETIDGSARLFGFRREEEAFLRKEYGGSVTLRRALPFLGADATLGYTYQALHSTENELETRVSDLDRVTVASVEFGLTRDKRDNPLQPRTGYRWYTQVEAASQALGGEVEYQRFEFGVSAHWNWRRGRWLHAGLSHGVLTTLGADSDRDLPVNKRFFPGGDSSIRGYQLGEASPRGADGRFLGAKTYVLLNIEAEQVLRGKWSAVLFFDALGSAARLASYPFEEELYSAGLGIRYQSIIGPLRLEYGRNLNPREGDPSGTLHFSVGVPF